MQRKGICAWVMKYESGYPKSQKVIQEKVSTSSELPVFPPLPRQPDTPNPTKQILALIFVLRIKLDRFFSLRLRTHFVYTSALPLPVPNNPLRLEYILANLVSLAFLFRIHILPSQYASTAATTDVANCMCTRNELARYSLVGECIGQLAIRHVQLAARGEGRQGGCGDEVCAAVAACEPFTDYRGGGNEVGETFVAAKMRGGSRGEEGAWCWGRGRGRACW
jgi:hypothetical protein